MNPTKKLPLFIITGASGSGKSTLCEELFLNETEYIVMEGDLLWNDTYNTPEDGFKEYRRLWMRLCAHIAQGGKPAILCGCAAPEQFEGQPERELFSHVYYLAVVCKESELLKRLRQGRGIEDDAWIKSSLEFNHWLMHHGPEQVPPLSLLDTTGLSPKEAARLAHQWILERL